MVIGGLATVGLSSADDWWFYVPCFAVTGFGLGLAWAFTSVATQALVPPAKAGAASGVVLTVLVGVGRPCRRRGRVDHRDPRRHEPRSRRGVADPRGRDRRRRWEPPSCTLVGRPRHGLVNLRSARRRGPSYVASRHGRRPSAGRSRRDVARRWRRRVPDDRAVPLHGGARRDAGTRPSSRALAQHHPRCRVERTAARRERVPTGHARRVSSSSSPTASASSRRPPARSTVACSRSTAAACSARRRPSRSTRCNAATSSTATRCATPSPWRPSTSRSPTTCAPSFERLALASACRAASVSTVLAMSAQSTPRMRREPPAFRQLTVAGTARRTPHLVRVTLRGADLGSFEPPDPAGSVRLLIPDELGAELVIPVWNGNAFFHRDGRRPVIRTLTPLRHDAAAGELDVDVVLHGAAPLSEWAVAAQPGDPAAVSGPGSRILRRPRGDDVPGRRRRVGDPCDRAARGRASRPPHGRP